MGGEHHYATMLLRAGNGCIINVGVDLMRPRTRCARLPTLGCWRTTRPATGPCRLGHEGRGLTVSAFCTLYGHVGYCRLSDGTDPVYQRPWLLPSRSGRTLTTA